MPQPRQITIQDLARQLNLDKSTISRALRGHPMVSAATRERVRTRALELNYRPSPLLSRIAARGNGGSHASGTSIVYVYCPSPLKPRYEDPEQERHYPGILARAGERGCRTEFFNLIDYGSGAALSRVLKARGIEGIIIGPVKREDISVDFNWRDFSAVSCGDDHYPPPVHKVQSRCPSHLAIEKAYEYGYRRIGLTVFLHPNLNRQDMTRLGVSILQTHRLHHHIEPVPFYLGRDREAFLRWFHTYRPDIVIGFNEMFLNWLLNAGVSVPNETAFLSMMHGADPGCAHININNHLMGVTAFNLCERMLHSFVRGLPLQRQTVCVEPYFVPGATMPNRNPDGDAAPDSRLPKLDASSEIRVTLSHPIGP